MFHHLAHLDQVTISKHDRIKRGQLIGYVGTTGASTAPHLHYEVTKEKPASWTQYTAGMTRDEVAERYTDPERYIDASKHIPAKYDRFTGYAYLQKINGKNQYHPGVDINSGKDGWADFRQPVLAPVDGNIIFLDTDGSNGGWGNHFWIEEFETAIDEEFAKSLAREKLGFYLQVEEHGELWIVDEDGKREYVAPENLMSWLREHAVGISNADLDKVPKK